MADRKRLVQLALLALEAERARIDKEITDLKKSLGMSGSGRKKPFAEARGPMTEAQKKAISRTMKKYWSKRRKGKAASI